MIWLLFVGLALLVLILLFSYFAIKASCGRLDHLFDDLERALDRSAYRDCKEGILAGRDWLAQQEITEVSITSFDGIPLVGEWLPHENARGTLLVFHGWRGSPVTDFGYAIQNYYNQGLNLLLVHQRAQGKSGGKYMTFGIRERKDVHSWVKWHADRFGADAPILLAGLSMGATTVLMSCGEPYCANVRGIVADCGFSDPKAIITSVVKSMHLPAWLVVPFLGLETKLFAGFGLTEYSTLTAMEKASLPIFFAHGEDDHFVPCQMTKDAYAACTSKNKTLLTVPGAGHGKSLAVDPEAYLTTLISFINRCLGEPNT